MLNPLNAQLIRDIRIEAEEGNLAEVKYQIESHSLHWTEEERGDLEVLKDHAEMKLAIRKYEAGL